MKNKKVIDEKNSMSDDLSRSDKVDGIESDDIEIDFGHFASQKPDGVPEDTIPPDHFVNHAIADTIHDREAPDFSTAIIPDAEDPTAVGAAATKTVADFQIVSNARSDEESSAKFSSEAPPPPARPVKPTMVKMNSESVSVNEYELAEPADAIPDKTKEIDLALETPPPSLDWKSADAGLVHSENLQLAQKRVLQLEKENEELHTENIELVSAAETLKNRSDQMEQRAQAAEMRYRDLYESIKDEKNILLSSVANKDEEVGALYKRIQDLEVKLQNSLKKVRVRERELENRLELVKMEGKALLQSKDEMILSLKRQIDQIQVEMEGSRSKVQDTQKFLNHKQDIIRRTVKTLRLALSLLETEDLPEAGKYKKAE